MAFASRNQVYPVTSVAETSLTIRWRALEGREEMLAEVITEGGTVKSESLDEASGSLEVSKESSRTTG